MSGWSGGAANRTWQRDSRGPHSGRIDLGRDVRKILASFRASHGWQPGMTWNPYTGAYELRNAAWANPGRPTAAPPNPPTAPETPATDYAGTGAP